MEYNKLIDNTLLKADATKEQIIALCEESKKYDFKSVCINPDFISLAKKNLKGSDVLICTVIGFPLGSMTSKAKAFEAKDAIEEGADEIDMVINISALKDKNYEYVLNDIKAVREATKGHTLKVILECCLLTKEEIVKACELCVEAKVDFVKTSTGFSLWGAKVEDVKLMRETVGPDMGVKAAGGVRTHEEMLEMVKNGATRIGTSSGAKLMK
ncbi:MAG: deoxyribose-phosphate aldolase [Firmicutes bacterium]|uniref:Deoxyribose-phosphate aldolase n=1 Tax=Candidatus Onthovivens merdipullorum TaxID=2840889 RepID=A0A9D9DJY3_9BACL|nr:deoxyribose-phosphate aldolase [Candidatus Onthovivens merdipullorum]